MAEYPADLVARPAAQAAALVCLVHLDAAHAAGQRLATPEDGEALHDFRVALRRLRSTVRAFRSELEDALSKKLRNRLRDVTRATASGRDAEVLIATVQALEAKVTRSRRAGIPWLLARLAGRRERAYEEIRSDVVPEYQQVERRMRKALSAAVRESGAPGSDAWAFGAVAAERLSEQAARLERDVATLRAPDDESAVHSVRITAKHLRYLLEPLVGAEPRAADVWGRVKVLQTLLGDLHDLQVLAVELAGAIGDAAAERARLQHDLTVSGVAPRSRPTRARPRAATTGLLTLARLVREAEDDLFRRCAADWDAKQRADLWSALATVVGALTARALPPIPARRSPRQPHTPRRRTTLPDPA